MQHSKILIFDISSSAGVAYLRKWNSPEERDQWAREMVTTEKAQLLGLEANEIAEQHRDFKLADFQVVTNEKTAAEYGAYPWGMLAAAEDMATKLYELALKYRPDVIVIEETNLGKQRYSQKYLEFMHCCVLQLLRPRGFPVYYVSSSAWRKTLAVGLSSVDKLQNQKLSRVKAEAKRKGIPLHEAKKKAGIRGKVTKKHVAIRYVNDTFLLDLRAKDDDIADAICIGRAFVHGAPLCDGK
jgi:Holliday junction resolvasome RuvABC endonuclease subunit